MFCDPQAVKIDASEVTVWYKMGILATKLNNYPLAKLAFEQVMLGYEPRTVLVIGNVIWLKHPFYCTNSMTSLVFIFITITFFFGS